MPSGFFLLTWPVSLPSLLRVIRYIFLGWWSRQRNNFPQNLPQMAFLPGNNRLLGRIQSSFLNATGRKMLPSCFGLSGSGSVLISMCLTLLTVSSTFYRVEASSSVLSFSGLQYKLILSGYLVAVYGIDRWDVLYVGICCLYYKESKASQ